MNIGYPSGLFSNPFATVPDSRLVLMLIVMFMVVSSPILIFLNPVLISAQSNRNIDTSGQHSGFSLTKNRTDQISPTNISPLDSGFTTQAAIGSLTATVNVPAGTKIRLEFANINNPLQVSASYMVTVTTRDAANAIIDGPSQSTAYTIKQIGTNAIADGSITSTKPAESFMKRVTLLDDPAGNALGWNPDGNLIGFTITEPAVPSDIDTVFFTVEVRVNVGNPNFGCDAFNQQSGFFVVTCSLTPTNTAELHYMVGSLPEHVP